MKAGAGGLIFLLAAGVVLCAALAGGQLWAMTGSVDAGLFAGAGIGAVLSVGARLLYTQIDRAGRQQMFASTEDLQDGEFVEIRDPLADSARTVVQTKTQERPDRVAGSVRSMMSAKSPKNQPNRKR
ncbi:MAG: hypothetical protein HN712_14065 [Gemmatimonadetes bacterium]|jgi:hypothetical protein|nr:hypothetical protein [Gemmatimonadota bacterium]MBT7861444.1 hypothetical protein [Gemmatimonadota bacterium]